MQRSKRNTTLRRLLKEYVLDDGTNQTVTPHDFSFDDTPPPLFLKEKEPRDNRGLPE